MEGLGFSVIQMKNRQLSRKKRTNREELLGKIIEGERTAQGGSSPIASTKEKNARSHKKNVSQPKMTG